MQTTLTHPAARNDHLRKRVRLGMIHSMLILTCALMLFPVLSTVLLSFKQQTDVRRTPPVFLPCDTPDQTFNLAACRFFLEGYERVILPRPNPASALGIAITGRIISTYLPNTIFYAIASAVMVTITASMAAYVFSRYRFRSRQLLYVGLLILAGIPLLTILIALYQVGITLRKTFPGYEERLYMVIVYVGFELPFAIWVVKSFFDTIPRELEEAALIDGCSPIGALIRVVAPLATPGLASIFLLCFVNVWNEFIANYLLMSKQNLRSAMYGVYDYISQSLVAYHALAAACILVMLPVVIVFLLTRNVFFRAMVEGALKG